MVIIFVPGKVFIHDSINPKKNGDNYSSSNGGHEEIKGVGITG